MSTSYKKLLANKMHATDMASKAVVLSNKKYLSIEFFVSNILDE